MTKNAIRITSLICAAVFMASVFTGCQKNEVKLRKITLIFDWIPNTNYVGAYVAKAKGWFAEEGLDVDFQQAPDGSYIEMVAAGKGDFGFAAQESLSMARAGDTQMPVKAIAAVLQHNTSGFASPASKGIKTPKDFENKTYSGWGTDIETGIIATLMKKENADPSTVKMVSLDATDFFATVAKDADFAWIFYGEDGISAEERSYPINFIKFQDIDPTLDFYTPVIIASDDTLKNDPELVRKFLRALSKGYTYAGQNVSEAADILCAAVPEISKTHAEKSIAYLANEYIAPGKGWGYMQETIWRSFTGWLADNKVIPKMPDIADLYTNDFLPVK